MESLPLPHEPQPDGDNDHDDQVRLDDDDDDADSGLADLERAMQPDIATDAEAAEGDGHSDAAAWQTQV